MRELLGRFWFFAEAGQGCLSQHMAFHCRPQLRCCRCRRDVEHRIESIERKHIMVLAARRAGAVIACCVHAVEPFVRVWRQGGRIRQRRERAGVQLAPGEARPAAPTRLLRTRCLAQVLGGRDDQRGAVATSPSARRREAQVFTSLVVVKEVQSNASLNSQ
jgi:hypothetical protein